MNKPKYKKVPDAPRYKAIHGYENEFKDLVSASIGAMGSEINDRLAKMAGPKPKK